MDLPSDRFRPLSIFPNTEPDGSPRKSTRRQHGIRLFATLLFLPLLFACTTIQKKPLTSTQQTTNGIASLKGVSDAATSSPNSASYYHAMLGLQYEEDRSVGTIDDYDRRALREYLIALEHDPKAVFLLKKISVLYNRLGNQRKALFYAEKALHLYPQHGEALLLLGDLHMASGNPEKGLEHYRKALQVEPGMSEVYFKLAGIYSDRKDMTTAEEMINKGIETGPPTSAAYYYLGRLGVEKGDLSEGLQFFQKALSLDPNFEPAHMAIAAIFERQKNEQAAIKVYRNVIDRVNPGNRQASTRLVQLLIRNRSFDEALILLDRLSLEDPSNLDIALQKTLVLVEKKAYSDAIKNLLPVVDARKKDTRLQIYLATLYEENDEVDKAVSAYQVILKRNPDEYDARIRLAYLYFYKLKNAKDAFIQANRAKEIDPKRIESYLFTGLVLHDLQRYEEAVDIFLEGLELKPSLPDLHFHLGATFDKLNRFEDMVSEMEKTIELDAKHANALNYLGYTYADKDIHLDKAIGLINRALAVRPNDGYFIDSLAWAYYKNGRVQDAIELLQKAISTVPDDPIIHEHLGEVYLQNNRIELARKAWERSLELDPENDPLIVRFKKAGFGLPDLKNSLQKIKDVPLVLPSDDLRH